MQSILQSIVASFARATIQKYKPIIIGVAGSTAIAPARMALFAVLKNKYYIRTAQTGYGNETGLALTILGFPDQGKNPLRWFLWLARSSINAYLISVTYPDILILEYDIERCGDAEKLLSIAKPSILVITALDEPTPQDTAFPESDDYLSEIKRLVSLLPESGYAILNHDDSSASDLKEETRAHAMTYGFETHADVKIAHYDIRMAKDKEGSDAPEGIAIKLEYGGSVVPCRIHDAIGKPHVYAAAAAACAGLVLNMNLVEISEALHAYIPPPGRMRLLKGIKNSLIIDDTDDATPDSMRSGLETLATMPGQRKIAVLGDIVGIERLNEQVHRSIGDLAAQHAGLLIAIGPRAAFIADEAATRGAEKNARRLEPQQIIRFDDAESAGRALDPLVQPRDVIFVAGSRHMRLEKAIFEIMAQPERAGELLVRQEKDWKNV